MSDQAFSDLRQFEARITTTYVAELDGYYDLEDTQQDVFKAPDRYDAFLDRCASPYYRETWCYKEVSGYDQRRRRRSALKALLESNNSTLSQRKSRYSKATHFERSPDLKSAKIQNRVAKRVAPRRMHTRSMRGPEKAKLADRKGKVSVWWKDDGRYMEMPYQDYEKYFVHSISIPSL